MPAFEYQVLEKNGRKKRGVMESDTARQVRALLREQGLVPLQVEEVMARKGNATSTLSGLTRSRALSTTELSLITRQLATLIEAATPIEQALEAVAEQNDNHNSRRVLQALRAKVREGHTLADSMRHLGNTFPSLYSATISAGEQSGNLAQILIRLADYTESRQAMKQQITMALLYPAMITIIAILVTVGLLTYVVPEVVRVFEDIDQNLPFITLALIAVSDFLRENGVLLTVILAASLSGFVALIRRQPFRSRWHRFLLRLPLVGKLVRGFNTARFTRTLAILVGSGVNILDALRISGEVVNNDRFRDAIDNTTVRVREGSSLVVALKEQRLFPPLMLQLVASGESSGNLDEMLERTARNQESEVDTMLRVLMALLEPLMILLMGVIVLTIVLAILLPIFELNELVN